VVHIIQTAASAALILIGYPNQLIHKGGTVHQFPEPIPAPVVPVGNLKKRRVDLVEELVSVGLMEPAVVKEVVAQVTQVPQIQRLNTDLPVENPKRPLAGMAVELAPDGTMEHVVVNAVAQIIQIQIPTPVLAVPAGNLKKRRVDLVEELVSVG